MIRFSKFIYPISKPSGTQSLISTTISSPSKWNVVQINSFYSQRFLTSRSKSWLGALLFATTVGATTFPVFLQYKENCTVKAAEKKPTSNQEKTTSPSARSSFSSLSFNSQVFLIPHPSKAHKGGEDGTYAYVC
jgi:hypothetical protein